MAHDPRSGAATSAKQIAVHFGAVKALDGMSIELRAGQVHGLVGQNGSGKSTLLSVLSGARRPDAGTVSVFGEPRTRWSTTDALSVGVRVIHQERQLCPELTVAENIHLGAIPMKRGRVDHDAMKREATAALLQLGVSLDVTKPTSGLSRAEQQLVEIVRAMHQRSSVLLMDEPTAALSQAEATRLFGLVERLRSDGCAILYVSHHLSEVIEISDTITVIRDGQSVGTYPASEVSVGQLRDLIAPGIQWEGHTRPQTVDRRRVLELKGVSVGPAAGLNIHAGEGEVVGLTGLLGSGHVDVANAIFGSRPLLEGEIHVEGKAVDLRSPSAALDAGIGMVPEDRKREGLLWDLTIAENAVLTEFAKDGRLLQTAQATTERASAVLTPLRVRTPTLAASVGTLSGGNQQKVLFGRWLAAGVRVLILIEPTSGVDVGATAEIFRLIAALGDQGCTVLVVSSDFAEVTALTHRAYVMRRGTVAGELSGEEITEDRLQEMASS